MVPVAVEKRTIMTYHPKDDCPRGLSTPPCPLHGGPMPPLEWGPPRPAAPRCRSSGDCRRSRYFDTQVRALSRLPRSPLVCPKRTSALDVVVKPLRLTTLAATLVVGAALSGCSS